MFFERQAEMPKATFKPKKERIMYHIIQIIIVACIATFATTAQANTVIQWDEAKPLCLKAQQKGERVSLGDWTNYDRFIEESKSFNDKIQVTKLWAIAANGSYGDLIIPAVGNLIGLYQSEIQQAKQSKKTLLSQKLLTDLIEITAAVDKEGYFRSHTADIKGLKQLPSLKEGQTFTVWFDKARAIKIVSEAYAYSYEP